LPFVLVRKLTEEAKSQCSEQLMQSGIVEVLDFTRRLLAINYPTTLQER
jgi:hypothetical protein